MNLEKTILIICKSNVGRSQMGQGYLDNLLLDKSYQVISAGVDITGMEDKYHNRPHPQVIEVMKEDDIDISDQPITQLTIEMVKAAYLVIILVEKELLPDEYKEFLEDAIVHPIHDPVPELDSAIPTVELDQLRIMRDEIKTVMKEVANSLLNSN